MRLLAWLRDALSGPAHIETEGPEGEAALNDELREAAEDKASFERSVRSLPARPMSRGGKQGWDYVEPNLGGLEEARRADDESSQTS